MERYFSATTLQGYARTTHGNEFVAGKDNVVVVCVNNARLDGLGTGGIMGPVMFYAPAAGDGVSGILTIA